ncbi:hypothetical protein H7E67_03775 [Clostridium gasigenes]|uniref:hypothetical protein n=1 Tax=Clostridium gasigenes TaxID=94869 RepID=UPI001625B984|nr:hypothetical protein [Clostridium gasigenes]MBB6622541.1 hypothetical protein [Clostridium gasigenes]
MDADLLYELYNFQFKFNTKSYFILNKRKLSEKILIIESLILLIVSFSLSVIILKKSTNIELMDALISSEIISFSICILYLNVIVKNKITTYEKKFFSLVSTNTKIKIKKFDQFSRYNILYYIYEHNNNSIDKSHFDILYSLIDAESDFHNSKNYINPFTMIKYSLITSLFIALINKVLSDDYYLNIALLAIFVFTLAFYYFFKNIFSNRFFNYNENYAYLKLILKKSELDLKYIQSIYGDYYADFLSSVNKSSSTFNK